MCCALTRLSDALNQQGPLVVPRNIYLFSSEEPPATLLLSQVKQNWANGLSFLSQPVKALPLLEKTVGKFLLMFPNFLMHNLLQDFTSH